MCAQFRAPPSKRFSVFWNMKKFGFNGWFRAYLFICIAVLGWSILAYAQSSPTIKLVRPTDNNRVFSRGTNVTLEAETDVDPELVRKVEFYNRSRLLGAVTNPPYTLIISNVAVGNFVLSAKVTDADGKTSASAPVQIRVHPSETWLTFGLDRVDALTYEVFEIPIWQYLAAFIYIFLAFYLSKLVDFVARGWLKKLTEKTETRLDDLLLNLLHGPVKTVSFVIFLYIGLRVFTWADWMNEFLPKAFKLIVICVFAYVLLKAIDLLMVMWKDRSEAAGDKAFDEQLFPVVRKSLKVFILIVTFLFICDNVFNQDIKAILTSLSIGGLALGLAAQDTLSNFFGAVVVFIDKPFRVGDRIQLPDVDGTVESIGLRSTRVRNLEGHFITVPNKTMQNATITNITRRPNIKTTMNIGLTYDTSTAKVKRAIAILEEIYRAHPKTKDLIVSFNQFGDSALNIMVVHWYDSLDAKEYLNAMQDLNLKLKERFDAEQISFAFPSRTVYLKQDSDWRLGKAPDVADLD